MKDSRDLAFKLVAQGQATPARAIANALLEFDPNDTQALLILSRAERLLGNLPAAKKAGSRAWRAAKTDQDRFSAAMLTAQAISSDGNKIGAQIWLRRAAEAAPTEQLKSVAVRDLRYLRRTSPLALSLDFSVAPSSNINNGSKSDTIDIFGLPFALSPDAQALSGVEYALKTTLTYKLPKKGAWDLTTGVVFDAKHYSLSSSAKALAPNVSGSDYAFHQLQFSLAASKADADNKGGTSAFIKAGQNWYGGSSLTRFAGIGVNRHIQVGKRSNLSFSLGAERQWRQDSALRNADVATFSTTWGRRMKEAGTIWITGYASDSASDAASIAQDTIGARIRYAHNKPIFASTKLELSLGYESKSFDTAQFPFARRIDDTTSASAKMIFNDLDYLGFAPTAEVNAKRTTSTVGQYNLDDFGVKLGLRSTF